MWESVGPVSNRCIVFIMCESDIACHMISILDPWSLWKGYFTYVPVIQGSNTPFQSSGCLCLGRYLGDYPYASTKGITLHGVPQCGACFGNLQDFLGQGASWVHTYFVPPYHLPRKISFPSIMIAAVSPCCWQYWPQLHYCNALVYLVRVPHCFKSVAKNNTCLAIMV